MNLSDADILELNELCSAVVDDTLTDAQRSRLSHWLSTSEDARVFYVRSMGLSASLHDYAAEMQAGEPAPAAPVGTPQRMGHALRWLGALTALAACVAIVAWATRSTPKPSAGPDLAQVTPAATTNEIDLDSARLTGAREAEWADEGALLGARLRKGRKIELRKGLAEITFDSGAQVLLQGPALLNVESAWSATLTYGSLKASVPSEAVGFRISTPAVEVVDLGTEFTMLAEPAGTAAEVLVLKGEVEAAPKATPDQQPILLRERESRRFAATGVTDVLEGGQKFEELTQDPRLDHLVAPIGYAHWSFDDADGDRLPAETARLSLGQTRGRMELVPTTLPSSAQSRGRQRSALRFNGDFYAKAAFPGMSANVPHTVAFWVNISQDAHLSNAYAMVAWGANSSKFGSHPFHISWNRNPNEGTVGALRTDYGRGYALGATSLRDGRWHHVAVVFMPTDDPERSIEVKQYVDGRLEGEGRSSPPGSDIFMNGQDPNATSGMIWLGCRLGIKGVRGERFHGQLDELFIADRALQPQEIVRLMNSNRLD